MTLFRNRIAFLMTLSRIRDIVVEGVAPISITGAQKDSLGELVAFGGTYQGVPTGYTLYNYITNGSNTRIATGIIDDVDDMEYEIRLSEATTAAWYIFSMRDSNTSVQYGISGSGSGSTITFTFSNTTLTSAITRTANHEYYIKGVHRNGNASLYVEDITAGTSDTQTATYNSFTGGTAPSIGVFGNGSNNVAGGNNVVSCRIVKSGKTVLDCVAAVKDANTRGLYDRISKKLLTAESGSVSAGAIRLPTPTLPVDIVCNNGAVKVSENIFNINNMAGATSVVVSGDTMTLGATNIYTGKTLAELIPSAKDGDTLYLEMKGTTTNKYVWLQAGSAGGQWMTGTYRTITQADLSGVVKLYCSAVGQTIENMSISFSPMTQYRRYGVTYADDNIETLLVTQLPAGYIPLEYIESTGTQYIDTGFIANGGMILDAKVLPVNNSLAIGSIGPSNINPDLTRNLLTYVNGHYVTQKLDNFIAEYVDSGTSPAIIHMDTTGTKFYATINEYVVRDTTTSGTLTNQTTTVKISYSNYSASARSGRYYYVKLRDSNNTLVFDGIPCRRNSDNAIGMYDTVSQTFFTNDGTGDFIAGPIKTHGKNLFDKSTVLDNSYIGSSGNITADGYSCVSDKIYVKPNTTYIYSGMGDYQGSAYGRSGYQYKADDTPISALSATSGTPVTVTTDSQCAYVRVICNPTSKNTTQLEEGSAATTYEPYRSYVATCEPLFKISTYIDNQDVLSGTVTHKIGVKVLDGTEGWTESGATNNLFYTTISNSNTDNTYIPMSSHFQGVVASTGYTSMTNGQFKHGSSTNSWYFKNTDCATAADFTQWLADQYAAGTPVIIIYPLATETTESVTGQTVNLEAGDGSIDIIQSAIDGLSLRAKYKRG